MTSKTSKNTKTVKESDGKNQTNPFGRGGVAKRRTIKTANNADRPIIDRPSATQATQATTTAPGQAAAAVAGVVGGAAINQANYNQNQAYQPNAYVQAGQAAQQFEPVDSNATQLRGVNGALGFFTFCFGASALGWIYVFFQGLMALAGGNTDASIIVETMSGILIGVTSLITLITICLRKKLAKAMAISTLAIAAVSYLVQDAINIAVILGHSDMMSGYLSFFDIYQPTDAQIIIGGVGIAIMQLIALALVMVYFLKSRRVRNTLTE